jgi:hypothetical protein
VARPPTPADTTQRTWSISPFFNELAVLEVKVREQMRWVDVFVFAESDRTYAGTARHRVLEDALAVGGELHGLRDDAAAAGAEIRVVDVDGNVQAADVFQPFGERDRWARENHQRAALLEGMSDLEAEDVVVLSDLDEIVRGSLIGGYRDAGWDFITVPPLTMHVASLTRRWWTPIHVIARLFRGSAMLDCGDPTYWQGHCGLDPEGMRRLPGMRVEVPPGQDMAYYGWHLSYMGGVDSIRFKLDQAAHPEMNEARFHDARHLAMVADGTADLFGRDNRPTVECPRWALPDVIARDFAAWQTRLEGDVRGVQDPH